ncbi:unnamed protein product [Caenorhabditis brenneri]
MISRWQAQWPHGRVLDNSTRINVAATMASTRNIDDVIDQIDVEEQQRLLLRTEQERKDREYAERLFREQLETPPRPTQSSSNNRGRRGAGRATNRGRAVSRRGNLAVIGARSNARPSSSSSSSRTPFVRNSRGELEPARRNLPVMAARRYIPTPSPPPSNGGGPIRRNARGGNATTPTRGGNRATTSTRGGNRATTSTRGGNRATTSTSGGNRATTSSRGRARGGGRVSRATRRRNASNGLQFNGDRLQARRGGEVIDITDNAYFPDSDDDSDYDDFGGEDREDMSSTDSDSEPEVAADLLQFIYGDLMRDNARADPNFQIVRFGPLGNSSDSDVIGEDESDVSDGSEDEFGAIRAERNNIHQEIREEDREMYNRELVLYHDDAEYDVPPPNIPTYKGKPMEPDTTWGDCTICSEPPIKPQGCQKCLQFLGCADCIRRWYQSRQDSVDRPTCPLCRAPWGNRGPAVALMPTIIRHREKRDKQSASEPSTSGPSTSAVPSTSASPPTSTTPSRERPSTSGSSSTRPSTSTAVPSTSRRGRPSASSHRRN